VTARLRSENSDPAECISGLFLGCENKDRLRIAGGVCVLCAIGERHGKRCCAYLEKKTMTLDESNQIEELLTAWYRWQLGYFPDLGMGRVDPTCRGFAENDRHSTIEERTDAAERKARKKTAEQVDLSVDTLPWQQRAQIQIHMQCKLEPQRAAAREAQLNAECGVSVWHVPRRIDIAENHVIYQEAKFALLPELRRRALIKAESELA